MPDQIPFFLSEAVLSLYPLTQEGLPDTDNPVWWGAVANNLRVSLEYEELRLRGSGDQTATTHHIDAQHFIDVERTWILPTSQLLATSGVIDWVPQRNTEYVMEMVWQSQGAWYRRIYYRVTGRSVGWESRRALEFGNRQSYRAESFDEEGGFTPQRIVINPTAPVLGGGSSLVIPPANYNPPGTPVYTPLPAPPDPQMVGFFRENALVPGEYLLGTYRWPRDAQLISAEVIAWAPQGTPNVLSLEVGGALTGYAVTIPTGPANTEVSAVISLGGLLVGSGQTLRWKITDGPDPANAAWVCALMMQVQPI